MFVPFESLPAHSRIWVYQANRDLTAQESAVAARHLTAFCESWNAHQQPLRTSFTISHNRFVILAADEDYHLPSGCSIDSSVRALKNLGAELKVDFFDRANIPFVVEGRTTTFALPQLKELFASGVLHAGTPTFNTLVPSAGDFRTTWVVPVEKTWLAKYLPKTALH